MFLAVLVRAAEAPTSEAAWRGYHLAFVDLANSWDMDAASGTAPIAYSL